MTILKAHRESFWQKKLKEHEEICVENLLTKYNKENYE